MEKKKFFDKLKSLYPQTLHTTDSENKQDTELSKALHTSEYFKQFENVENKEAILSITEPNVEMVGNLDLSSVAYKPDKEGNNYVEFKLNVGNTQHTFVTADKAVVKQLEELEATKELGYYETLPTINVKGLASAVVLTREDEENKKKHGQWIKDLEIQSDKGLLSDDAEEMLAFAIEDGDTTKYGKKLVATHLKSVSSDEIHFFKTQEETKIMQSPSLDKKQEVNKSQTKKVKNKDRER